MDQFVNNSNISTEILVKTPLATFIKIRIVNEDDLYQHIQPSVPVYVHGHVTPQTVTT